VGANSGGSCTRQALSVAVWLWCVLLLLRLHCSLCAFVFLPRFLPNVLANVLAKVLAKMQ
jgi:hypothetical protein